jgi:hypothetical protein
VDVSRVPNSDSLTFLNKEDLERLLVNFLGVRNPLGYQVNKLSIANTICLAVHTGGQLMMIVFGCSLNLDLDRHSHPWRTTR